MIRKGSNQAGGSALTGDWKPMDAAPQPEPTPPAPTPAAQPQPAVSRFATLWLDSNARILLYPHLHIAISFAVSVVVYSGSSRLYLCTLMVL